MRAVILAAGHGTRIEQETHGEPKCLLRFGNRTVLDYQIEALQGAGISRIGIVIGHQGHRIVEHIARNFCQDLDCFRFFRNAAYATTNNIYSVWTAREWVESDDFICLDAHVPFHPAILASARKLVHPVSMIVDPEWHDEAMKVILRNGRVVGMSKAISRAECDGTYLGITTFSRASAAAVLREIEAMVARGQVNQSFSASVQTLADRGLRIGCSFIQGLPWAGIEEASGLRYAIECVYPRLPRTRVVPFPERSTVPAVA